MWSVMRTRAGWQVVEWPGPNPVSEAFPTEREANAFMAALAAPDDAGSETIVRREWPGYAPPGQPPMPATPSMSDLIVFMINGLKARNYATMTEIRAAILPAMRVLEIAPKDQPAVLAKLIQLRDRW